MQQNQLLETNALLHPPKKGVASVWAVELLTVENFITVLIRKEMEVWENCRKDAFIVNAQEGSLHLLHPHIHSSVQQRYHSEYFRCTGTKQEAISSSQCCIVTGHSTTAM